MSARSWALSPSPPPSTPLTPESVEKRLRQVRLMSSRLQLLVSSALVWLIFVFGAISGGIPPLMPTLLLGAWIIASTLWLSLIALRAKPETLVSNAPGRIALLCTLITVVLATLLIRDTAGDFYIIYFFPIAVATIYYGIRGGFAAAFFCAISYVLLGLVAREGTFSSDFSSILAGRIVLLFAMAGTIGVSAEGQLALIHELDEAYSDLKTATAHLEETQRDLTRRVQEDSTLEQVAQQITTTLEPDQVLSRVLERIESLLDAEASTLMTLDSIRNELVFQIPHGSSADALRGFRLPVGQGVAGWVAEHKEPLRVDDTTRDSRFAQKADQQSGFQTRSLLAVPMMLQDRVIGVLEVLNKRSGSFTLEDERLLSGVARWAAIALENARLYVELQASMDQLRKAQEQLLRTERLRALGEMAGGVAHDFNNLLTIILAESQILQSKAQDTNDREALARIGQAARDGAIAVRRIQESTRIRRDSPQEIVNVNSLLKEVAAITRPRWSPFGALNLDLRDAGEIQGSPSELREVLMNLVFNAVEARSERYPLEVVLRSYKEDQWIVIEVQDNGTGIPAELKQRIFDPYFTTKAHGTGLGLSITYGLISRHGGEIQVTSPLPSNNDDEPPHRTRFTIRLPSTEQASKENPSMTTVPGKARPVQILFVDDDPNILAAARSLLGALGNSVTTAQARSEAEEQLKAGNYDVLMTDLTMPECSGWDLAKQSKELHPNKPVVLVTGWGLTLDPEQMKSGLVNSVLSKPFTLDELQNTIAQLV
ncbi:MAG TPA: GAF domain-containing protein [Anaerolineae bacterium]|nr:GAF domain-containing protein [Anaerolineae bacterium]